MAEVVRVTRELMPEWTEHRGGRTAWREWASRRVTSCRLRADKWLKGTGRNPPSAEAWRRAVLEALTREPEGRGIYSGFEMTLKGRKPTDALYPSIEHLVDPATPQLALEARVVNDMVNIMSRDEFLRLVGHISAANEVPAKLEPNWAPTRNFAKEQGNEEPPLPDAT